MDVSGSYSEYDKFFSSCGTEVSPEYIFRYIQLTTFWVNDLTLPWIHLLRTWHSLYWASEYASLIWLKFVWA